MNYTDPLIGRKLGDYTIEGAIGQGGMARVYRGYDPKLERYAAVKIIDAHLVASDNEQEYRERFMREARSIAKLSHPNIVGVYQLGNEGNIFFMAMAYLEGQDLRHLLKQHLRDSTLMPHAPVVRIVRDIALALDYAHQQGVIHRDVKPSNIMVLDSDKRAVLTDFGLALSVPEGTIGNTFGSVHYVAPEQAVSSAKAVPQSDLYSLGICLYEMLTGRVPFDDQSAMSVALKHLSDPPPPISDINPKISHHIEEVVMRVLDKDPRKRYQTGYAFAQALEMAFTLAADEDTHELEASKPGRPKPIIPAAAPSADLSTHPVVEEDSLLDRSTRNPSPSVLSPTEKDRANNARRKGGQVDRSTLRERTVPKPLTASVGVDMDPDDQRSSRLPLILGGVALLAVIVAVALLALSSGGGGGAASATATAAAQVALNAATAGAAANATALAESAGAASATAPGSAAAGTETAQAARTAESAQTASAATSTAGAQTAATSAAQVNASSTAAQQQTAAVQVTADPAAGAGTPTPEPAAPSATPLPTANPDAQVLLVYDSRTLFVSNRDSLSINISGLTFERTGEDGTVYEFDGRRWGNEQRQFTFRPQDCFQVWTNEFAAVEGAVSRLAECQFLQGWRQLAETNWFWIGASEHETFTVVREGVVLGVCPVVTVQTPAEQWSECPVDIRRIR